MPGGPCKEVPGAGNIDDEEQSSGCEKTVLLCSEDMGGGGNWGSTGPYVSAAKNLWHLRSELKQKEDEVKRICKNIKKYFKKCKGDMACEQTKKICERDPEPGSGGKSF